MKTSNQSSVTKKAFTLLELTVVIMMMLALMGTGLFVNRKMDEWKFGREASETLRSIYSAQRMFLADNPTRLVSSLTSADIIPYLQNGATSLPSVKTMKGVTLGIKVSVSPPVCIDGGGVIYDPSGREDDGIWDANEKP